jgi:hypothetical protein
MRGHPSIALLILLAWLSGCAEIQESWEACAEAAEHVHQGDAEALCRQFSDEMLEALPCDAVERVLRQTVDLVGEPNDECSWGYTYRAHGIDPLQATSVYKCPFARESVKVTVAVEVREAGTRITGLWSDSPSLRSHPVLLRFELCKEINESRNACVGKLSEAHWNESRISVWNSWQNLRGGDRVAWEWLAPNGGHVARFEHQVEEDPPFNYRTWAFVEPAELQVAEPFGLWTVKLGLNGKELEAFSFEVVRRGAPAELVSRPPRPLPTIP